MEVEDIDLWYEVVEYLEEQMDYESQFPVLPDPQPEPVHFLVPEPWPEFDPIEPVILPSHDYCSDLSWEKVLQAVDGHSVEEVFKALEGELVNNVSEDPQTLPELEMVDPVLPVESEGEDTKVSGLQAEIQRVIVRFVDLFDWVTLEEKLGDGPGVPQQDPEILPGTMEADRLLELQSLAVSKSPVSDSVNPAPTAPAPRGHNNPHHQPALGQHCRQQQPMLEQNYRRPTSVTGPSQLTVQSRQPVLRAQEQVPPRWPRKNKSRRKPKCYVVIPTPSDMKPPSAFSFYNREQRCRTRKELNTTDNSEVKAVLQKRWDSLSQNEKTKYEDRAQEAKQIFEKFSVLAAIQSEKKKKKKSIKRKKSIPAETSESGASNTNWAKRARRDLRKAGAICQ